METTPAAGAKPCAAEESPDCASPDGEYVVATIGAPLVAPNEAAPSNISVPSTIPRS
jgi:hypothetical protein